ncbi:hypothetical protein IDM40_24095 [Nocardiopsis sp. HNM0947]|uniref:Uncharacterized protein n=1 Tax=Nocardiopsis coralli TaxID=2772213 RepID=A0ABR9PD49_9ACTN|nr:hypothetical protein [Nocardiopsis coralli]MBE3001754.1 hypothetical protein [Nocardiopsis coralli]
MGETDVDTGTRALDLRAPWGRRSRARGWDPPEDWWTPAVDAVCAAHDDGRDLTGPCTRLGAARARGGIGVGQSMIDLAAFTDVAGWETPPLELLRALAEGWTDAGRGADTCQDPLTGLANAAYLRTRLAELYRCPEEAEPAAARHRLLVVSLAAGLDPWRRAARLIVLGHELGRFFTRGESVCVLSRGRVAALVPAAPTTAAEVSALRSGPCRDAGASVCEVSLPATHREAVTLLDILAGT